MRAECRFSEIHRARIVRSNRIERPGVNGARAEEDGCDETHQRSEWAALLLEEKFHGERWFRLVKQRAWDAAVPAREYRAAGGCAQFDRRSSCAIPRVDRRPPP